MRKGFLVCAISFLIFLTLGSNALAGLDDVSLNDLDLQTFSTTEPMFTITALSRFDGKSGNSAYVSVEGEIFDLSSLRLWSSGNHMALHTSGQELTYELKTLSPHKEAKTADIKPVGLLVVTLEELKNYNGKDGKKSYVAVGGKVYDFSRLGRWPGGSHQRGMHLAGNELTSELLKDSPHGVRNISGIEAIAVLGITIDELKEMDGHDGRKAYVSVEGKVYDVSELAFWRNGSHQGDLHLAGNDLTKEILDESPHGISKLDKAYLVGLLIFTREQLARFNGMAEGKRYVAYDGTIFDVSDLELWVLDSGAELSNEEYDSAIELLQHATEVGYLVND